MEPIRDTAGKDVMARLEKLERENRRFKAAGLVVLAVGASLCVSAAGTKSKQQAAAPADEIRAKRFVMVDSAGRVRATLDTEEMGWPHLSRAGLTVYSADNTRKAVVASDNLLNQVSLENSQPNASARYARMQVGTEGVGLELSEFFGKTSSYNLFGVHWASENPTQPTLEITNSKPNEKNATFRVTPSSGSSGSAK